MLDRLIPRDSSPGAVDCGVASVIEAELEGLERLLGQLAGFEELTPEDQDATLVRLEEADPEFRAFIELAHVAYYADARAWAGVRYNRNLPRR